MSWARWWVVGLTAGLLAVPQARAGIGFQPATSDELKMTAEPLAPGAPAIILYRQVDRDDDIHTPHEDNYFRIKILTEEGRKHADIEIPFLKENENINGVHARTIRTDGSIVDFNGKIFEKELIKRRIEGRELKVLTRTLTLPDVQVGSIIEYSYTRDFHEHTLNSSRWILSEDLFTKRAQFSLKPFSSPGSVVYTLRWSWHSLPNNAVPPKEGPDHVIRMEASNIPAFETEEYMPPAEELKSRVDFIYEQGIAPKDEAGYWRDFGTTKNSYLDEFIGKQKDLEPVLAQIVSAGDSQEVKLRKIYARVQQFRNTTYEPPKSEQEQKREKGKNAQDAADVWKQGYGTRAQLNWLFLGLLRAAGFEAYGCMVSDRKSFFFTPVTMQGSKLNTNVVLVKLNGQDLYLAAGAALTPFGLLPWWEAGVPGLRLDKDGGTWIKTTLPAPSESRIERVGQMTLSENGDLEGNVTVTLTGLAALHRRVEERNRDNEARKRSLERMLKSMVGVPAEIELTNSPDWASSETPLVAEFKLKIPAWTTGAGKRVLAPAVVLSAVSKDLFEHENRVHPIYFEHPYQQSEDLTIALPSGWQVSSVPLEQDKDAKVAAYNLKVEQSSGTLRLTRKLTIDIMLLEPKYYPALRNFFEVVRTGDAEQIVLQPGEIHASN